MSSLMCESFKAEANVLFSNFLVSASADTKVKMHKSLLAWGRGIRAVHQLSGGASTHILESVDAGILGPQGERETSLCKHLLSACSACSLFHLTWPCVLEPCRRTACNLRLQSQGFASPLVKLGGCQASLQAQCKRFYLE